MDYLLAVLLREPLGQELESGFDAELGALDVLAVKLPSARFAIRAESLHPIVAAIIGNVHGLLCYTFSASESRDREACKKWLIVLKPSIDRAENRRAWLPAKRAQGASLRYPRNDLLFNFRSV